MMIYLTLRHVDSNLTKSSVWLAQPTRARWHTPVSSVQKDPPIFLHSDDLRDYFAEQ